MPVLDGDFEAFVTNLGKYNEGMLVGEWVKLPTTEEEMQKVFERIGIGKQDEFGQPYEEWFITDYECPIYGVQKMLGEYESPRRPDLPVRRSADAPHRNAQLYVCQNDRYIPESNEFLAHCPFSVSKKYILS